MCGAQCHVVEVSYLAVTLVPTGCEATPGFTTGGRDDQLHSIDLGHLKRGSTVVVSLRGNAANVRLLDATNFNAYKAGRQHKYYGGLVRKSPHRIAVPRDGRWYVTVDMAGMRQGARVTSSVNVEPPPLPMARSATPASLSNVQVERPPAHAADTDQTWDVFVSHASEDKTDIARPSTRR
jgi:hypothetical protein